MKKLTLIVTITAGLLLTSCKKQSLQTYLVESQEKAEFVSLDLPSSVIQLSTANASEEDKKAYESIKKINLVALPYNKAKEGQYESEKNTLKEIFKSSDYKKLMNFKNDGKRAVIYYKGETDAIDEIIVFGYGEDAGVGIARLLGDNMNPNAILKMMKNNKVDVSDVNFKGFTQLLDQADVKSTK